MKTLKFILLSISLISSGYVLSKEPVIVYARLNSCYNNTVAVDVINKRLQTLDKKNKAELWVDNRIKLSLYEEINRVYLQELLLAKGDIYIYETCENFDIYPLMLRINEILKTEQNATGTDDEYRKNYPWFSLLEPNVDYEGNIEQGCVVGRAQAKDTVQINAILNRQDVKAFSQHIVFRWTAKPVDMQILSEMTIISPANEKSGYIESLFELIAIKKTAPFSISSFNVDKASKEINRIGFPELCIHFKKEAHQQWAEMTKNNLGKCLAIMYDGKVLSYPRVYAEITGGNVCISGHISNADSSILLAIIKGGTLECNAILEK